MTTPNPPPEGEALERARQRARISQREAARRADISETRWRQITKGHHITGGVVVPDVGPAETIARMAIAVGMTADEMADAGRHDAAILIPVVSGYLTEPDPSADLADVSDEALLAELGRRLSHRPGGTHGNAAPTITADLNRAQSDVVWSPAEVALAARHGEKDD